MLNLKCYSNFVIPYESEEFSSLWCWFLLLLTLLLEERRCSQSLLLLLILRFGG